MSKSKYEYSGVITKRDLISVVWRGIFLQLSWNYERMQALGYCYCILPILKKLYKDDPEGLKKAVTRNLEFFNTQPYMAMPIMGTTIAMEERLATKGDVQETAISSIKVSLMGPLAGIGDSMFWFTIFPICAGIGIGLSQGGNIFGPIMFVLLFSIFNVGTRYLGVVKGYELGAGFIEKLSGGVMQRISEAATIIGLMVLGVMSATMIVIPLTFTIGQGTSAMTLQGIFDSVMPNLLPLLATLLVYKLMKKGMSTTKVLFGTIAICILGAVIGIF